MYNITTFLNYLADHWSTILMVLGASGLLPAIVIINEAVVKKLLALFTETQKKFTPLEKQFLVYAWGVILSIVHYVMYVKTNNVWIVAVQGALLFVTSQPFYHKLWKPLRNAVAIRLQETAQRRLDAKAALVPPEGLPVTNPPTFQ